MKNMNLSPKNYSHKFQSGGLQGYQTMRVTAYMGKKPIHMLIDSGNSHNFLDLGLAKKMGCKLDSIEAQAITVADVGQYQYLCKNFEWKLLGAVFSSNMLPIPLGRCEVVLRVQWLSTFGIVKWDFKNLKMESSYKGIVHTLRGNEPGGQVSCRRATK